MKHSAGMVLAALIVRTAAAAAEAEPQLAAGSNSQAPAPFDGGPASEAHSRRVRDTDRLGWYVPDYARLQTGGYAGLFAVGLGYAAFADSLNITGLYGFTPAKKAGQNVSSLKFAIDFRPFDLRFRALRFVPIYPSAGLLVGLGGEYFTRLPSRYRRIDSKYYPPTALHWIAALGTELDFLPRSGTWERLGVYYELAVLDTYFVSYLENSKRMSFTDVFASTLGVRAAF